MRWFLVLALIALPAWGAEIQFDAEPRLGGTFRVVVTGVPEEGGQATLLVLRTGAVVPVALAREGDVLRSAPIHIRRACDPEGTPSVSVQLGDTVVAATELGGGLAAPARVGPRGPDEPTVALERWDNVEMEWVAAEEMGPALFRIVLTDPSRDTTCEREALALELALAGKEFALPLEEDGPVTGKFVGEFVVALEPRGCDLGLRVTTVGGDLLTEAAVSTGACLTCTWEGASLRAPLPVLPIALAPEALVLPVGCVGEVHLARPERPDEVRWCVDGVERAGELSLTLLADAPRDVIVVALVRKGLLWERAQTTVAFVPQVKLSWVDATTGLPPTEPWPCTQPLQIRADDVTGPAPVLLVGKLGPDPRIQEIPLAESDGGVFVSGALRPADFAACAGDVLWAQFRDPRGCYSAYITLPLR
ncbi:MAG TPA: hypothetical protein PKG50_04125 [Candidatus Bipolaricaulis anaerobius]|nr:hypothetical protein [Candidatus Bipolaricaulis anaerobius]HNS23321.1 hypothetical protein [Candidatus Bipolaricaulis anaerobius]